MAESYQEGSGAGADFDLSQFYQIFFEEAGENLDQMEQMKNLGSMEDLMKMIPGMDASKMAGAQIDEKQMARTKAIIQSMTKAERHDPEILTASRRKRIARGSGTSVQEVNRLMNQFNASRQMMKQMSGRMKKGKRGGFPFGF